MNKRVAIIVLVTLILTLGISYTALSSEGISDDFRPQNLGFSDEEYHFTTDASSGTVLVLQTLAGALLYFAAPIGIIMFILAAFNMVIGSGDSEKIETAKKQIVYTIVGLLVIILSYSAVRFVITRMTQAADTQALSGIESYDREPSTPSGTK